MKQTYKINPENQMRITGKTIYSGKGVVKTGIHFTDGIFDYYFMIEENYYPALFNPYLIEFLNEQDEYFLIESMTDEEAKADRLRTLEQMELEVEQIVELTKKAA